MIHKFSAVHMHGNSIINGRVVEPTEDWHIANKSYVDYWDTISGTYGAENSNGFVPIPVGGLDTQDGDMRNKKIKEIMDLILFPKVNPIFKDGEAEITNPQPWILPAGVRQNIVVSVHNILNDVPKILSPITILYKNAGETYQSSQDTEIIDPNFEQIRDCEVENFVPIAGTNEITAVVVQDGILKSKENNYFEQIYAPDEWKITHSINAKATIHGNLPVMVFYTEDIAEDLGNVDTIDAMYQKALVKSFSNDFGKHENITWLFNIENSLKPKKLFILVPSYVSESMQKDFLYLNGIDILPSLTNSSKNLYYKQGYIGKVVYKMYYGMLGDRGFDEQQYLEFKRISMK